MARHRQSGRIAALKIVAGAVPDGSAQTRRSDSLTIRSTALHLDLSEGQIRVALHRLRKQCRKVIEDLVMEGLREPTPEAVADELDVLRIVSGADGSG
jgi:hypothetical protein